LIALQILTLVKSCNLLISNGFFIKKAFAIKGAKLGLF